MNDRAWLIASTLLWPLAAWAQGIPAPSDTPGYTVKTVPGGGVPTPGPPQAAGMAARFAAANTTHDGRLTAQQARAAHLRAVVEHFDEIDSTHKGYVTEDDLRSFRQRMMARRAAQGGSNAGVPPQ